MEKLKIGDKIYSISYGSINSIHTIDRVTNNFAFSGENKFKIDYDTSIDIVPRPKWSSVSYILENNELKKQLIEQQAKRFVSNYEFHKLPIDKILKVNELLKSF